MIKNKKQFKCYLCKLSFPEEEITYKEDDVKRSQPICHQCLQELFYGDKCLEDN